MSEMVERVAKAMLDRDAMCATPDGPGALRRSWQAYVPLAEAAIEAMREPTEAMWDACGKAHADFETGIGWRVMIDAALAK